nr:DNA-binding protein [Burkholderia thailandensis]
MNLHEQTVLGKRLRPFGQVEDIIPRNVPVGEAMALLAGLLVKCIDEDDFRTAQELMKHELFNSRTLEGVVLYARRKTESALLERINALHEQIAERAEEHEMSRAHLALLEAEQRERQEQAKLERQKAIKPAQAARLSKAKNTKIIEEFNRRRRNGEDFQGRNVCSDIAARFGVTADHVRKLKRAWLAG